MEIGIWGDSITYGQGDVEALGWVGRLRKSMEVDGTSVYNFGVCGDTSENLLKRFATEATTIEPNLIIFAVGLNDCKYETGKTSSKIPLEKYKENMQQLVTLAKNYTNKIYIVGATKADEVQIRKSGTRFVNQIIKTYNDCLKEVSDSERLTYIDVFDVLDITTDLADGLHPNAQGYEKLFKVIRELVK